MSAFLSHSSCTFSSAVRHPRARFWCSLVCSLPSRIAQVRHRSRSCLLTCLLQILDRRSLARIVSWSWRDASLVMGLSRRVGWFKGNVTVDVRCGGYRGVLQYYCRLRHVLTLTVLSARCRVLEWLGFRIPHRSGSRSNSVRFGSGESRLAVCGLNTC